MKVLLRTCVLAILALGLAPVPGYSAPVAQDRDHVVRFRPLSGSLQQSGWGDASLAFEEASDGTTTAYASFGFWNLRSNTNYTVIVNGFADDGSRFRGTYSFTTDAGGRSVGQTTFDGLASFTSGTVRQGDENGMVILTAV